MRKKCAGVVFGFALLSLLIGHTANAAYSEMYVFGDSLSDSRNVQIMYESAPFMPGVSSIPSPNTTTPGGDGYYQGRATNGPTYADHLSQLLGFSATADLKASLEGGTNYAYSGARTNYHIFDPSSTQYLGLIQQATAFTTDHPVADSDALYVVFAGANNLQDILMGQTAFGTPPRSLVDSVGDIQLAIDTLYAAGARHFLVPNAPNLGLTPRVTELESVAPGISSVAQSISLGFNTLLDQMLDSLVGRDIVRFDTYAFLEDLVASAATVGLTNTAQRCYTGDDLTFGTIGSVCSNPDEYLFWDGVHPTAYVHGLFAQAIFRALPEPSVLWLALMGIVAATYSGRRKGWLAQH